MSKEKIGIISIHYGVNFGSALQAIALSRYLKDTFKYESVDVINYIPKRFRKINRLKNISGHGAKHFFHGLVRMYRFEKTNRKYVSYLKENTSVSKPIYSMKEAKAEFGDYGNLIAGSDQIWNSEYNQGIDEMYYLGFASEGTTKIAYAASCGKEEYSDEDWNKIRRLLGDFSAISLREKSSVKMMEEHGIRNCKFVLDPTFLFGPSEWKNYEKEITKCPKEYLLIYFLDTRGEDIVKLAKKIAVSKGLRTVLIRPVYSKINYDVDMVVSDITPDKYIWLFRNASFVVTNSFHGVSFSINMERQFVALKRDKYNSRLDNIMNVMGLSDRFVTPETEEWIESDINYSEVNKIKSELLKSSKEFLLNTLQ